MTNRARVVDGLAKLTRFLDELGVVDDEARPARRGATSAWPTDRKARTFDAP